MTTPPVPLPAERIPPGTADWRTHDTRRWLAAVPAKWAHPLWAVLALVVSIVWELEAGPVAACTSAAPCGTDWPGLGVAAVLLLTPYWVWRQPRLAVAGLATGVVTLAMEEGFSTFGRPSALAFLLSASFITAGIVHRLALAGRQRSLALEAAGPAVQPLPAAARTFRRGRLSFVLAALALAGAGFGFWQAQGVVEAYEERAAGATELSGRVTALDEGDEDADVLTVTADGRTHRIETAYPEDFPVGSRVDIVVDGDRAVLVAEPYDVFGWEMLVLGGSVAGLAFLANGVAGRVRSGRLRRGPLPVLRVLVREDREDSRTWVFAADDPGGLRPVLHFHSLYAFDEDEDDDADADDGRSDDDYEAAVELDRLKEVFRGGAPTPPLREAVLYGVPYTGAEVAFVARDDADDDEVAVECSVSEVKPAVAGWRRSEARRRGRDRPLRPADEVAAGMTRTAGPRVWRAHGFSRAVGLFLLPVQGGGIWASLDDGPSWTWLLLAVGVPWLVTAVATALTWRITADRDGLWVTGAWRVRRVPWDVITSVRHADDGIRVDRAKDSAVEVSPAGWAWLERRLGRRPGAERAAEEVRALLLRPELRPQEEAPVGRQGMPVGPPLAALSVLWGAAVLLLL
ncbi:MULTISPECIES: hypothetical protein [Streptomyces]|uniref:PH domain-containing protein n=1 Tax=Streptomyces edwardsiae TaxID=3075527 RepID=A0ABU2Q295_9ACTN|nr:hypothetical protein [Streptomyces sp. DSM 41636]MDT0398167.1 hypothetical protein [Streptomyces sp. DSM 41636]